MSVNSVISWPRIYYRMVVDVLASAPVFVRDQRTDDVVLSLDGIGPTYLLTESEKILRDFYLHKLAEEAKLLGLFAKYPMLALYSVIAIENNPLNPKQLIVWHTTQTRLPTEALLGTSLDHKFADHEKVTEYALGQHIPRRILPLTNCNYMKNDRFPALRTRNSWLAIASKLYENPRYFFADLDHRMAYATAGVADKAPYYQCPNHLYQHHLLSLPEVQPFYGQILHHDSGLLMKKNVMLESAWSNPIQNGLDLRYEFSEKDIHTDKVDGVLFIAKNLIDTEPKYPVGNDGTTNVQVITIHQPEFSQKSKRILIAGHDLRFIKAFNRRFKEKGYCVEFDQWRGHNNHDLAGSKHLLESADVIICEWCLGNVVWYSQNKKPHQKLIVRFHSQKGKQTFRNKLICKI